MLYTRSSAVFGSASCKVPSASVYGCVLVTKLTMSAERQTLGGPRTRGTNSWLDDTDKNFGPDLPLLFKLHEIWSVDSYKIIKIVATRCPILRLKCTKFDFGYSAPPDPLAGFKGPTSKVREGGKERGREVEGGRKRGVEGKGVEGRG